MRPETPALADRFSVRPACRWVLVRSSVRVGLNVTLFALASLGALLLALSGSWQFGTTLTLALAGIAFRFVARVPWGQGAALGILLGALFGVAWAWIQGAAAIGSSDPVWASVSVALGLTGRP